MTARGEVSLSRGRRAIRGARIVGEQQGAYLRGGALMTPPEAAVHVEQRRSRGPDSSRSREQSDGMAFSGPQPRRARSRTSVGDRQVLRLGARGGPRARPAPTAHPPAPAHQVNRQQLPPLTARATDCCHPRRPARQNNNNDAHTAGASLMRYRTDATVRAVAGDQHRHPRRLASTASVAGRPRFDDPRP